MAHEYEGNIVNEFTSELENTTEVSESAETAGSVLIYSDGQPCNHQGCLHHLNHPCEGCGRIGGKGMVELPKWLIAAWKKHITIKSKGCPMKTEEIDKMVDRFLTWKLPHDFSPDGGISFARTYNGYENGVFTQDIERTPEDPAWPVGTNLLTAEQARSMIEHILAEVGA